MLQETYPETAVAGTSAALAVRDGGFLRFGKPHRILSGSIHYFRVHPSQWADRLERLAAMGLNTVDTYIPWNFHEAVRGRPDFTGRRDLGRFIDLAAEAGLDVIVRPGPYICAEWDNGGLPWWVTRGKMGRLRCATSEFTTEVARWLDLVMPVLIPRQAAHGGPIVAVQVENEYGSYGDDADYLAWLRGELLDRGVTELLYTADGPTELMFDGGTLEGTFAAATFGSGAGDHAEFMGRRRPGEPLFCAEYWNGWFDHWGEKHHVREPADAAKVVRDILEVDGSVSLYMAHGGTNFGLTSGANFADGTFQPTITSYDSDAPVAENGALTPKFHAMRAVFLGSDAEPVPAHLADPPPTLPSAELPLVRRVDLLALARRAGDPVTSAHPLTFEELGVDAGMVVYRARPILPEGPIGISIEGLRDRAYVHVDGHRVGTLDRNEPGRTLELSGTGERVDLEIIVENQGRINYGSRLGETKGIVGGVLIGRRLVHGWEHRHLALAELAPEELCPGATAPVGAPGLPQASSESAPGLAVAVLDVDEPADAFLALPGSVKGFVWINGFLLGRYWNRGPQATLYVPAPLLASGENIVSVLELEGLGDRIEIHTGPSLGMTEEFIETF
ncbi:beta-galactosidase family protein [Paeniglutamicibacter sp. MACA_103]|uniref:glycoside hydrolase family 35 protein n=1 Tax=Paeniglutamicibacter sp. MACA_103 TaxID=3377337 RepID=UPI003894D5D5